MLIAEPSPKAGCGNTANVALGATVEIYYPLHPFCGKQCIVVARLSNGNIWVREEDGRRLTIPAWMIDKWFCQTISLRQSPICSVAALMNLRDLLAVITKGEDK